MDAFKLLLSQHRFDLIYKYLYVLNPNKYNRDAYIESIRSFTGNSFFELEPSDGVPKQTVDDYVNSFDRLIENIKAKGYDKIVGAVPLQTNGEVSDGAHRLAVCAALGIDIEVIEDSVHNEVFNYVFFRDRKMNPDIMDYGALEYVKLNPNTFIVNLHAATSTKHDEQVVDILNKYGWIYYQKDIQMNLNGYVNLVKLSYGSFWEREQWIGDETDGFAGALNHAKMSFGKSPMRIFVFVCDDLQKVLKAKAEIRALFDIGNNSVHINDTHEEAIWLAETYFNKNSLYFIKHKSYKYRDKRFDANIEYLRQKIQESHTPMDSVCCVGSTPMNAYGLRKSSDLDYLSIDDHFFIEDEIISPHDDQLRYYKCSKEDIVNNPQSYFYYHGVKICTLNISAKLKFNRHEFPKDWDDLCVIMTRLHMSANISPVLLSVKWYQLKKHLRKNDFIYKLYKIIKGR